MDNKNELRTNYMLDYQMYTLKYLWLISQKVNNDTDSVANKIIIKNIQWEFPSSMMNKQQNHHSQFYWAEGIWEMANFVVLTYLWARENRWE